METPTAQSASPAGETPWHAASVDEVARLQEVDPAQGLSSAAAASAPGAIRRERARGEEEGVGLAGVPAPVPRRDAAGPARCSRRQPDLHAGDQHDACARRADGLQRGLGHEPGGQGRGELGRVAAHDEERRPGAARRTGRGGRRERVGARRCRAGRGGQPDSGRRPPLRRRDIGDRRSGADRRERRVAQDDRRNRRGSTFPSAIATAWRS